MNRDDYSLYILRCADGSFYTGIARDVDKRVLQHEEGAHGAKYLRGRKPFTLVFRMPAGTRSAAQRLEHRVRRLSRARKRALIDGMLTLPVGD